MLSATDFVDAEFVLASSLPIDTSPLTDLVQAAPVVMESEASSAFELSDTFLLHSNPGASRVLYLDFDGHTTTGTTWNTSYTGGDPIVTPAYSFEGDSSFSDNELTRIQYIWQRVAEDYLPFEMDVTTEDPGLAGLSKGGTGDTEYGLRVCIGGSSTDWYGESAGGLAYVGSFTWQSDTPVFVFTEMLGNGSEKYTAEAISHETGHSLGLYHDGVGDGTGDNEYYGGHSSGDTGWAPIMGTAYYKSLTQFSKGEYLDANNSQSDLEVMASRGGFGFRSDDHSDSFAAADSLTTIDGVNVSDEGIIGGASDLDYFSFETGEGAVSLSIDPAPRGPNLDILAMLYDSSYQVVATSNPIGALNANFSMNLAAGTYYLVIDGTGEGEDVDGVWETGYSDYGSVGYYSITGTIVDPDSLPWLTISAADASASEKGSNAGTFTVARTGSTTEAIEVFYTATGSAENGLDYDAIPNSVTIPIGSYTADITIFPINDSLREGDESATLTLNAAEGFFIGTPGFATVTIADDDLVFTIDDFAVSEATVAGELTGSLAETMVSDDQYEGIKETLQYRYSIVDHTWAFDVAGGGQVTFFVEAYHSVSSDGDDFLFECSTDGENWTSLLTVTKTSDDNTLQQAAVPNNFSGTVFIRVRDTDHRRNHRTKDTLFIDLMFIRSDPSIFGDTNLDGVVDALDYITIKKSLGTVGAAWSDGDFDKDGDVDYSDLAALGAHFGETLSSAPAAVSPAEPDHIAPAAVVEAVSIAPVPVAAPALSQEESFKWFAAMSATARNSRVDVFATAGGHFVDSPFNLQSQSPALPWWLRPKRDK